MLRFFLSTVVLINGLTKLNAGTPAPVPVQPTVYPTTVAPAPVYTTPTYTPTQTVSNLNVQAAIGFNTGGPGTVMTGPCVLPTCGGSAFATLQNICAGPGVIVPGQAHSQCMPPGGFQMPQPVIEEIVMVSPQQIAQATGSRCGCMGQVNCPCTGTGVSPLLIINATPPPVWMTDSFQPRWKSFDYASTTVYMPQPRHIFRLTPPTQFELPMNPRDTGEIQRAHGLPMYEPQEIGI